MLYFLLEFVAAFCCDDFVAVCTKSKGVHVIRGAQVTAVKF